MFLQVCERLADVPDHVSVLQTDHRFDPALIPFVGHFLCQNLIIQFLDTRFACARRTEVHIKALSPGSIFDQQNLLFKCLAKVMSEGIFGADIAPQFVIVPSPTETGLQLVVHPCIRYPDVFAGHQFFSVRLEDLQQGDPSRVQVFA